MTAAVLDAITEPDVAATLSAHPTPALVVALQRDGSVVQGGVGASLVERVLGIDPVALASADADFDGRIGARTVSSVPWRDRVIRVVLVGIGSGTPTPATLFRAALAASAGPVVLSLLGLEAPTARGLAAVAEGHVIRSWTYERRAETDTVHVTVVTPEGSAVSAEALRRAGMIAEATNWVRRLVETPPNLLGPGEFAQEIASFAAAATGDRVQVAVWDATELAERGMGATLGVGRGSARTPLAVELRVDGAGPLTALAGKGITFDSGGTNIKRDMGELSWMKSDMAAAASVAAAVITAAALGAPGPLRAVLPVAENMPGGGAQRPGDVVTHPDGRTTEVIDTDCEGRLVLADALALLSADRPAQLIDVGTLTDSGGVGHAYWGCWGTSTELARSIVAAGDAVGDPGWELPLHDTYTDLLSSRVADIANSPVDVDDSGQLAATYLRSFVGETPWVHIDNGSAAWLEHDAGPWPAGATGTPLRALVEFLSPTRS